MTEKPLLDCYIYRTHHKSYGIQRRNNQFKDWAFILGITPRKSKKAEDDTCKILQRETHKGSSSLEQNRGTYQPG